MGGFSIESIGKRDGGMMVALADLYFRGYFH